MALVEFRYFSVCIVCIMNLCRAGEIIRKLKADGWFEVATQGSHLQLKHPTKPGRVTVPHPKKDLPLGTLKSIERQASLTLR